MDDLEREWQGIQACYQRPPIEVEGTQRESVGDISDTQHNSPCLSCHYHAPFTELWCAMFGCDMSVSVCGRYKERKSARGWLVS